MENETSEMIVKRVSVPIGLEELMEGLSKEVLLKKPDDLYEFAARYFSKLLLLRDKTNYKVKTVRSAQTVTEQNRRLTRVPYGTLPKALSRQFSIRDHSATRRNQLRQPRTESPRRQIHPQTDSLASKRDSSKTNKNGVTQQSSTKNTEAATEQLEPSVNKVALSSRRPRRRYDSKRSSSHDKNETQSKGTKSSNASASESADTIERTEMIPKRRESNSSTLSNVPSIESSEAKFNTDSPAKAPKDVVKDGSTLSTPRDKSSTDKTKSSKRDVGASDSSGKDIVEESCGTKPLRDGKAMKKSTSKVSPRSDSSKCDTQRSIGSDGRNSKAISPSKDKSKAKLLKEQGVTDKSSKNYGAPSASRFTDGQSNIATAGLANSSTADHSTDKVSSKEVSLNSGSPSDSIGNKAVAEHSATQDTSKAAASISGAPKNGVKNNLSQIGEMNGKAKDEKDSSEHTTSVDESQKDIKKDGIMNSDSVGKSRIENSAMEATSHKSESKDTLQKKPSSNEERDRSSSIRNQNISKAAESISEASEDGTKNDISGGVEDNVKHEKDPSKHMTSTDKSHKDINKDQVMKSDSVGKSETEDKLHKAPSSNEERDRSSSIHNQDVSKAAESISEASKYGTKNDLSQIPGEFEGTAKNEKDSAKHMTSADGSQKSLEKDGSINPDSAGNVDALKSTSHESKTEDKLQTKPSSNEKRDHSNGIHNQNISEATESISKASKNGAKNDLSKISDEVDSNAKKVKDSLKHMTSADESQKDLEKDGTINCDSAGKPRIEDHVLEGTSESEKMIQKNLLSDEERDQSSSICNPPDISCASNQHFQQSSPKDSGKISESSSLKSTEHCSKVSKAGEDGTKCSQIGQKNISESGSYAASEEKIQDNSTSVSTDKLPTDSKVTENQSLVDSSSPKISQNKINTRDDTKMSSKEETRSISSSEEDKKGKCVSIQDSSIHISSDSKKSPKEMKYNNIGKSSLERKSPANMSSNEENHERSKTSDLEGRECVAKSSTLEHQPPYEGSSKSDPQKNKSSTTTSSENQSPQNDLIERKAEEKDNYLSHASLNSTNMDRSSSADKTVPLDESSKIIEQDIVKSCSGTSKETSKSDETNNFKDKDGAKENTNTHNISNDSDTTMQPRTIEKNQIKSGDDLTILDVRSETSRVSDEKLRHGRSVKSPKSSSKDKLKSANGSEKKKSIKESNQVELSTESDKNTSIHSATSSSQANKLEEHGDSNSTGLSQESEQASASGKQVESIKQEVTENKVTDSTESSKNISDSNDKDGSVGSEQPSGNTYPVAALDGVEKKPLSNSEKTVASMNILDSGLILAEENDDIKTNSKKVISPTPSNIEVSTTEAITSDDHSNNDDQANKDDLQRKSTSGNSEIELNVNLTNEEAKSLSSRSEQHKNIVSKKTTTHSTDEVNVSDNLTTHTSEGDSDRSPGVTKIQDVSDPKQALLTNTNAELNNHKIKHNGEENSGSSKNEKLSSTVGSTDAKHIANGSKGTSELEVDTSEKHADLKEFKTGAENTEVGEDMAISLVGREMLGKSTNLKSEDVSVVDGKSVSENSEIEMELPQTTEHGTKSSSSSTSSGKTKTTDDEPKVTGLSNTEVGHGATREVTSDSSQPKSIFNTNIDRDLDKTDTVEEHAPKEQNTNTNSNKPDVNKGKVVILNTEIANSLPNTSGENEKTDNTSATVQGNQSDKARNNITEMQAPVVSEISIGKGISELNQHTSSDSSFKTGTTVSSDENRIVSDKTAGVNGNSTESTQAASSIKGYETKGAGLTDENNSSSINVEVKGRQKIETQTSAISSAANVMDKDIDSAAKNSESDHSIGSTVPHELSPTTSNNVKSDDKKQESSTEVNQVRMPKDAKKKSVDETKSAGQEKIKKSLQKSLSLETGSSPSNSGRLASSSLKSGSKESSRLVNDLPVNAYPKKSAISSRDNGDRVSTSKSKEPSEISKNRQVSPKKLTLPENQQPNPKDSTAKSMSNSSSSSSAGSSKLSSNKEQSADSGNNSLTTSSSEKEVSKDRCDVTETQTNENQKPSSSHKRALQRSSKVVESSGKSLSTSRGSGSGEAKPTAPSEKVDSTEKRDKTGENKLPRSNASEEKRPVLDKTENSTKDKKAVPSLSVDKEINDKAKASLEAEPVNSTKNIPLDTVPKKMSLEDDNCGASDNSEKVSSSKASKIPIKINHKDDQRANVSAKADGGILDTNLLSVKNVEPEKDEVQKMKQELEEANTHNMDRGKKNHVDGISDEDRLILEKLNIDVTKDNTTSFSKQDVDQTCGTKDVGVDGVDLHRITTDAGGVQTIDSKEQKSENHMNVATNKLAESGQTESQIESIVGGDDVSKIALRELHSEHTKDASKSSEAETSIVGDGMQNHSVTKRATEEYDSEKSSMSKSVGQIEKPNVIQQTLQHKNELHPDVKGFINQFIQNEQENVYKEHCLCREVRLHDDEKTPETSSKEQNQAVDEYNAESGKAEDIANTSSTSTEQDAVIKNQSKQGEGGGQTKIDLIGLTLKHKDGLHPDVKGFLGNFIEKEQENVYKEHCSCKEVSLHDTTDDIGANDKEHMSPDAEEHKTTIQKQRYEEIATHIDDKVIKRGYSIDSAKPNGYLNYKIPTAEVKGIQALTVQDQNGKFINKANESNKESSRFDIAKLREELERVQDESKMNTFHSSYNPYKLRQELKQYSSTASDKNNNTHKTFSAANAVLKIQSMWRGFLVRKVLKRDETLEKRASPVKANGVLKSGIGEKAPSSATIIANGGHTIPKDTNVIDPPIELSLKEQKVIRDEDSTTSGRINNKLEASMTLQVSDSRPDKSSTASSAALTGVLKTENSQSYITLAANGGQKIPKDEHVIGTVNEVETNSAEPSEASNSGSNKEAVTDVLGSNAPTAQKVETVAKHSQNMSHGVLESDSGQKSDQNSHSSETPIDNKGYESISKESHTTLDQSRETSLKDVSNRESLSKSSELSLEDPSSAAVSQSGLQKSKNAPEFKVPFDSHLKDSPKYNTKDPKGSHADTSTLQNQKSSKPSSSGVVHTLPNSEASNTEKEDAEELEKAATALQSMWRGFKARKGNDVESKKMWPQPVRRKRKTEDKDMRKVSSICKEDAAALKIQSLWKAYVARKGIDTFKVSF
ncbi:unnamed protein product [Callosobruchus maculatus]|uniref:RIIa domain-containing protein n=1 Tax=Callosobruchus maculatus TaxID=64391 RepID=A0A653C329_CALMS|nr:unnamed protein product [Callosobruchus maculatus]